MASHDLEEPLRKVNAFGKSPKQKLDDRLDEADRNQFVRMLKAAARTQAMIQDLLELSRVTAQGKLFKRVKLQPLAENMVSDLEVLIVKENGRVVINNLPAVQADPVQMESILMNLIGNALKYHRQNEPPVVQITGRIVRLKGQEMAEICETDNGIGFNMDYVGRIFHPIQCLHGRGKYEGTGMGLAICKKIIEHHGGTITAQSQPGKGSMFIVTLPMNAS